MLKLVELLQKLFAIIDGAKSYAGAVVQMLAGAGAVVAAISAMVIHVTDPSNPAGLGTDAGMSALLLGLYAFGNGLKSWGMAHKTEKQTAAIETQTAAINQQTGEISQQTTEIKQQTQAIEEKK